VIGLPAAILPIAEPITVSQNISPVNTDAINCVDTYVKKSPKSRMTPSNVGRAAPKLLNAR